MPEENKLKVYFNEFNVLMDKTAYLPLVSGLLQAYAQSSPLVRQYYEFMPFLFRRDKVEAILSQYESPGVAAFSVSMWNEQLCLRVAKEVKARWPECLIIFGGPQPPFHPAYYFVRHPFIDVTVRGEGEGAFRDILERWVESQNFEPIPGISWREPKTGRCIYSGAERPLPQDLDIYPSPYLSGLFDSLIDEPGGWQYQAIIETNRGCPYRCTYCFWGQGGLSRKFRFHSLERIKAEIEWVARNRILYLFNADSNFGFHTQDYGIAEFLVQTKKKYGFPEKFRSCYAKNSSANIYRIAKLLHGYQMEKGITLSLQSNCVEALKNVRRQNIKIESFKELQLRFNHENIPVYTELILGLPGESYQSLVVGIEEILTSGLRNQLFIYQCQVYPNSELADPEYQKRFGIITRRLTLNEMHGEIHPADSIREYEDIVIATYSMTVEQWRQMSLLSWVTMLLHSLKLGYFILFYLHHRFGLRFTDFLTYLSRGFSGMAGRFHLAAGNRAF